jgi:hypothetical protein
VHEKEPSSELVEEFIIEFEKYRLELIEHIFKEKHWTGLEVHDSGCNIYESYCYIINNEYLKSR